MYTSESGLMIRHNDHISLKQHRSNSTDLFKTFDSAWSAPPSPVFELRIDKFQRRFGQILERAWSAGRSQHKLPIAAKCAQGIDPESQKCWQRIEIVPKYEREEHKLQRNAKYEPQRKLHLRSMHISSAHQEKHNAFPDRCVRVMSCHEIFIGPRSDHSLPMSLTNWLTDSLTKSRTCWRMNELT